MARAIITLIDTKDGVRIRAKFLPVPQEKTSQAHMWANGMMKALAGVPSYIKKELKKAKKKRG